MLKKEMIDPSLAATLLPVNMT